MARSWTEAPFGRGQTFSGRFGSVAADGNDGTEYEGQEYWFPDINWSSTEKVKPRRSGREVIVRIVRNKMLHDGTTPAAGATAAGHIVLPKRLVVMARDANENHNGTSTGGAAGTYYVNSYARIGDSPTTVKAIACFPTDEFLPTSGVPYNDLFYVVVSGPAIVTTATSEMQADIALGDELVAFTAATSGATSQTLTTGGRINRFNAAHTDSLSWDRLVGRALSACTSQGYVQDLLIDVFPMT